MFTLADVLPSMLDISLFSNKSEISQQNALLRIQVPELIEVRRGTQQTEENREEDGVENIHIVD